MNPLTNVRINRIFKRKNENLTCTFSYYISYYFLFFNLQFKTHTVLMTAISSIPIRAAPLSSWI